MIMLRDHSCKIRSLSKFDEAFSDLSLNSHCYLLGIADYYEMFRSKRTSSCTVREALIKWTTFEQFQINIRHPTTSFLIYFRLQLKHFRRYHLVDEYYF